LIGSKEGHVAKERDIAKGRKGGAERKRSRRVAVSCCGSALGQIPSTDKVIEDNEGYNCQNMMDYIQPICPIAARTASSA
jgi:hypothetical protein